MQTIPLWLRAPSLGRLVHHLAEVLPTGHFRLFLTWERMQKRRRLACPKFPPNPLLEPLSYGEALLPFSPLPPPGAVAQKWGAKQQTTCLMPFPACHLHCCFCGSGLHGRWSFHRSPLPPAMPRAASRVGVVNPLGQGGVGMGRAPSSSGLSRRSLMEQHFGWSISADAPASLPT